MITVQIIGERQLLGALDDSQLEVVALHAAINEGLNFTGQYKPDIILLDYNVAMDNIFIIINLLLQASPQSRLILMGEDLNDELVTDCLANGAYGYLAVNTMDVYLIKAFKAVYSGEAWISRKIAALLIARLRG